MFVSHLFVVVVVVVVVFNFGQQISARGILLSNFKPGTPEKAMAPHSSTLA